MNLLDHLKAKAEAFTEGELPFEGFAAASFKRAVVTKDGLAFQPGEYGLVEMVADGDSRAFSFRTNKFAMVRPGSFEMLPPDAELNGSLDNGEYLHAHATPVDEDPQEDNLPTP